MRRLVITTVVLAALAAPPAAFATFVPGPNGKVTFTSGRGGAPGNDNEARIWVADYPFGMPVQATTVPAGQHRHPNWSPDHTRIVYAVGVAFSGTYALWIKDLTDGSSFEFVPAAAGQDRPSWSPDGTSIAYGAGGDIWVKAVDPPGATPVQITQGAAIDERPVWSPDGNTLYFNRGPANDRDIYKKSPVTLAGTETGVLTGMGAANDDWQPALSPDGQRLCYLRGPQNDGANLRTVNVDGTGDTPFSEEAGVGDLNCQWSPDGTRILYTRGAFTAGQLASRNVNGGDLVFHNNFNVAQHFDGNADWATNFSPACEDRAVDVGFNDFATVALACTDPDSGAGISPPAPEPLEDSALEIVTAPAHGVIGSIASNGTVIYTPDKDFEGSDSFTYTGSDGTSNAAPATVALTVAGPGGGPGPGGPGTDTTAPEISDLSVSPRRWRRGPGLPAAAQAPVGTTIAFRLSEAAETTLRFRRARPGRRVGSRCVKPTRRNRARKRCKRYVAAGRVTRAAEAGLTRLRFEGRLSSGKRLGRGRYRLVVAAEDAAGNTATSPRATFTIVR